MNDEQYLTIVYDTSTWTQKEVHSKVEAPDVRYLAWAHVPHQRDDALKKYEALLTKRSTTDAKIGDMSTNNGPTDAQFGNVPTNNTASGFLERANDIMRQRAAQYDSDGGERSMANTVLAFNAVTGHTLAEEDGWLLMQILKDVRQWKKEHFHQDSADDCVAYCALKAEALAQNRNN